MRNASPSTLSNDQLYQVLIAPVVTEKSTRVSDQSSQVVFQVANSATRNDVKAAIEQAFEVNVDSVKVLNVKGKAKRFGKKLGQRSDRKKAYIRLKTVKDMEIMTTKLNN